MSIETLQTLAEQYRAQIEALQKENQRLTDRCIKAEILLAEMLTEAETLTKEQKKNLKLSDYEKNNVMAYEIST